MLKDILTQTTTAIESLNMSAVLQMTYICAHVDYILKPTHAVQSFK